MFRRLQVKNTKNKDDDNSANISIAQLIGDASLPVTIKAVNSLPDNPKLRLYRTLIPVEVLSEFNINPRTWKNPDKLVQVKLDAQSETGKLKLKAWYGKDEDNLFFYLELADNPFNGIDLNFLIINDPLSQKFEVDFDSQGRETHFGTVYRNLEQEKLAMQAGLSPGQSRGGLRASKNVFSHIENFLTLLAHHAMFLEPLSYVSAWVFERRGFAYSQGHKLMNIIHQEFQPGGELHKALDNSTPFRQAEQWNTTRGRAWAIHDGILDVIDQRWDGIRMIKQVGRNAGVNTFPNGNY